jgi:hypothetical protein
MRQKRMFTRRKAMNKDTARELPAGRNRDRHVADDAKSLYNRVPTHLNWGGCPLGYRGCRRRTGRLSWFHSRDLRTRLAGHTWLLCLRSPFG